jgi:hypothetical protein
MRYVFIVFLSFMLGLPAMSSFANNRLGLQQRYLNMHIGTLKELEPYVAYFREEVETKYSDSEQLAALDGEQINNSRFLDLIEIDGSTGKITFTITTDGTKYGLMTGSHGETITLTPVVIGGTTIEWDCTTTIPNYTGFHNTYHLLNFLEWPLAECRYEASGS